MNGQTIYSHIQLCPGDIIIIDTVPEGELSLPVVGVESDTGRLILSDGQTRFVSLWNFFLKEGEGAFRPLNDYSVYNKPGIGPSMKII